MHVTFLPIKHEKALSIVIEEIGNGNPIHPALNFTIAQHLWHSEKKGSSFSYLSYNSHLISNTNLSDLMIKHRFSF
jgi:hypothetical protein